MIVYELIVRELKYDKCKEGYIWCKDGTFVDPSEFKSSGKAAYGYALDNYTVARLGKSVLYYTWTDAKSYCENCSNADKSGYFPSKDELKSLHSSIMNGKMKEDLIKAELYKECDYGTKSGWYVVWSSTRYASDNACYVYYDGNTYPGKTTSDKCYAIPFFKF